MSLDSLFFLPENIIICFLFVFFLFLMIRDSVDWKTNYSFQEICLFFFKLSFFCLVTNSLFLEFSYKDLFFKTVQGSSVEFMMNLIFFIYTYAAIQVFYRNGSNSLEFLIFSLFSWFGVIFILQSKNLVILYLLLEVVSFSFYILTVFPRKNKISLESGFKYFVLSSFSSVIMLFGVTLSYFTLGNFCIDEFLIYSQNIFFSSSVFNDGDSTALLFSFSGVCIFTGILFKMYVFPFHFWVADVYQGSPSISAFLFSILPIIPFFFLLYSIVEVFQVVWEFISYYYFFILISFGSMIVGSVAAIQQRNLRRLLAYSSVSSVGYYLTYFLYQDTLILRSVFFFVFVYVTTLFGVWLVFLNNRFLKNSHFLDDLNSLSIFSKKGYLLSLITLFFMFSLAGLPPFPSFLAKIYWFVELVFCKLDLIVVFLLTVTLSNFFFYLRVGHVMIFEKKFSWEFASYTSFFLCFGSLFLIFNNGLMIGFIHSIMNSIELFLF